MAGVECDPRAPPALGLVEEGVGPGQDLRRGVSGYRAAQAGAEGRSELGSVGQGDGASAEVVGDAFEHGARRVRVVGIPQAHHELVPAPARDPVALAHVAAEGVHEPTQTGVPGGVSERVVRLLQPVGVEYRERQPIATPPRPRQVLGEAFLTGAAVVRAAELVPAREIPQRAKGPVQAEERPRSDDAAEDSARDEARQEVRGREGRGRRVGRKERTVREQDRHGQVSSRQHGGEEPPRRGCEIARGATKFHARISYRRRAPRHADVPGRRA